MEEKVEYQAVSLKEQLLTAANSYEIAKRFLDMAWSLRDTDIDGGCTHAEIVAWNDACDNAQAYQDRMYDKLQVVYLKMNAAEPCECLPDGDACKACKAHSKLAHMGIPWK